MYYNSENRKLSKKIIYFDRLGLIIYFGHLNLHHVFRCPDFNKVLDHLSLIMEVSCPGYGFRPSKSYYGIRPSLTTYFGRLGFHLNLIRPGPIVWPLSAPIIDHPCLCMTLALCFCNSKNRKFSRRININLSPLQLYI